MTLVGFKAQNHPQQTVRRGADDDVDDRRTPRDLLDECKRLAGVTGFDLDAAASGSNTVTPYAYYTAKHSGLTHSWWGRVWCNPPYSDLRAWVDKAAEQWDRGRCERIVMLLPANRTEQGWWQDVIEPARLAGTVRVYFLRGRRRFDRPGWTAPAKGDRPPFGLCVVVWGPRSGIDTSEKDQVAP